jgi:hypothetical protein
MSGCGANIISALPENEAVCGLRRGFGRLSERERES